jgi:NitT/TauT family transport system substrate-binding protein
MARFLQPDGRVTAGALLLRAAAAAALALAGGCSRTAGTAAGAPVHIRFKTDWYAQAEHGGFYQAQARGFYKEAGIDVDIQQGGPGALVTQILLAGDADIAIGRSDDMIVWASQGTPFVIVGVYMERDPQAILVHDESPVRTFRDLNHRTIMGVQGSNWIEYLKMHYHIDFNLIPSNFGIGQFLADKNFIQQCFVTNEPYYVRKAGAHPRTLLMSDAGFSPYRVIYTTKAFANAHPDAVRAFVAASYRGWEDFMNGDPSPAKAAILAANPNMDDGLMNFSINAMREQHLYAGLPQAGERAGLMSRKRLEDQDQTLLQLGISPELIPLDRFARFDLMPSGFQPDGR